MTRYAYYAFPFGLMQIGYTDTAIFSLYRMDEPITENQPSPLSDLAFAQIRAFIDGQRRDFDFPYELHGTAFQKKVWHALCDIPYGETRTYKQIAQAVGSPKGYRAVGLANHCNPIMIVVPCHRVLGSNNKLTGYAGGLEMKAALLALERENKDA